MKYNRSALQIVLCLGLVIAVAGCGQPAVVGTNNGKLQGTITVSGAWALYPMMVRWGEEFQKQYPDVRFDISAGGAGKGMADALAGAVDIGMVSRDVTPQEEEKGAFWVAVTKDAVFPTVNANNPVWDSLLKQGIDRDTFIGIYITGQVTTWGQVIGKPEITDPIHVYTRSDAAGAPETWAKYLGKNQEDLLGVGVYGDPGVMEAVIKDPLGIGFNNLNYAYDVNSGESVAGSHVVPVDVNADGLADESEVLLNRDAAQNAVADGKYPAPPARDLNLVTRGKPEGLVKTFLQWTMTDGQAFVGEAGYISLSPGKLQAELGKLD